MLNDVTIIVLFIWDVRPSCLILVVGLMGRWEWWVSRGVRIYCVLWVTISHSVMPCIVRCIRSTFTVLGGNVQRLWVLRCVVGYICFICCKCFMSSFILNNCCWRATGLVSKDAAYWLGGVFIASLRLCISTWIWKMFCWRWFVWVSWTSAEYGSSLIPVCLRLTSLGIDCRTSFSWVSESVSAKMCFRFAKVTASPYVWGYWRRSACFNLGLIPKMK